jgi:hypothetical protein
MVDGAESVGRGEKIGDADHIDSAISGEAEDQARIPDVHLAIEERS